MFICLTAFLFNKWPMTENKGEVSCVFFFLADKAGSFMNAGKDAL